MQSCFVFQHIWLWKDIHLEHQLWGNSMFQRVDLGQAGSSKSYSDMETDWHCLTSKKVAGFYRATTWNTILHALIWVNRQEKHTLLLEFMGKKTMAWKNVTIISIWWILECSINGKPHLHGGKICHFYLINVDHKMWALFFPGKIWKDTLVDFHIYYCFVFYNVHICKL